MKKIYILIAILCSFSQLSAQYYWQITEITSISNAGTYDFGTKPENIVLNINQCSGGITKPHNSTAYTKNGTLIQLIPIAEGH
ncbi:hypothetical protein [Sporocytophaga myxococcoides]|uniref:hypothetical protein n=1 Tax=Sporocytophaga myxococcoides TaxID=153721 RepID=UPI0012E0255D|nr:hypothetical protein [Sporocytophaga myxococcoides]